LSESDENDEKIQKLHEGRLKRVKEIRDSKRKRKPESDIEVSLLHNFFFFVNYAVEEKTTVFVRGKFLGEV
jgi:hypothetical protein